MTVYRITQSQFIHDLSGSGAALNGGRWSSRGTYIVYTAQSRALALLEVVVHTGKLQDGDYSIATIEIPDNSISTYPIEKLPPGWNMPPPPNYLRIIGDQFIKNNNHLALQIPSVLMMEEHNYLLNPAHPLFSKVLITSERSVQMDERLFALKS